MSRPKIVFKVDGEEWKIKSLLIDDAGGRYRITVTLEANELKQIVQATAGAYVAYTTAHNTIEEGQLSLSSAEALMRGVRTVELLEGSRRLILPEAILSINQSSLTESWSMSAQPPLVLNFLA
jgi:hypothetical protein